MTNRVSLESALEKKCVDFARSKGFLAFKLDKIARGWPDHLFLGPSKKVLVVEFKIPGQLPSPQQNARHSELMRRGFPVYVVTEYPYFVSLAVFSG